MLIARLLLTTAILSTGACFAQNTAQPAEKTHTAKQSKPTAAKPAKPKKEKNPKQTGTKLHPQQEQAYAQAYKSGAVKP
jgi:hypothetical protein